MASKTSSSFSNKNSNRFLALEEVPELSHEQERDTILSAPVQRVVPIRRVPVASCKAPSTPLQRVEPVAPGAPRKAVYRSQLVKPVLKLAPAIYSEASFPQLVKPGLWKGPGIWGNTATIHKAVDLPDPAIAEQAAYSAKRSRTKNLVDMYSSIVDLDDIPYEDVHISNILEERRARVLAIEVRQSKIHQPPRRRLTPGAEEEEDENAPDETLVMEEGRVYYQKDVLEEQEADYPEDSWDQEFTFPTLAESSKQDDDWF